ncbi:uncharacterized protein F4812DRAFT_456495 [Daldinia caldariorum]|uniref:uncharacterized protein n=1 Tax=Daldinia caldariorum TaxID=326644 RepID=UPI002007347B|nr:uncharacterized protein F4812DRAFT_456495 [Daldinia caldariorum]KAI1470485.1 hypothetical protein F4812DRAFT_456495 [Daldinia caldariorum]
MDESLKRDIQNNGPHVNYAIWIFAALATLFLGLRVACKCRWNAYLWYDDWFLIASWVLLIVSCAIVSANVAVGFGRHDKDIDPAELDGLGIRSVLVGSLCTLSAAWSKTSFAVSLLRIASPRLCILIWTLTVSMNIFMHSSIVLSWASCQPVAKWWDPSLKGECWPPEIVIPIGIFFSAYSGFMDFVLALLPWVILRRLRMDLKEKIGVAVAMSMGVFAGATAIVKSYSLPVIREDDFNYLGVKLVTRSVAEIAITIIAASIPVLRTLVCDLACLNGSTRGHGSRRNREHHQLSSSDEDGIIINRIPTTRTGGSNARGSADMTDQVELRMATEV